MNQFNELKNIYDSLEDKEAFLNEFPVDIREHVNTSLIDGNEELFNQVIAGGSSLADISNGNPEAIPTVGVEEPAAIVQDVAMDPVSAENVGTEVPASVDPAPETEINPAPEVVENQVAEETASEDPEVQAAADEVADAPIENPEAVAEEVKKEAKEEAPVEEEVLPTVDAVSNMDDEIHHLSDEDIASLPVPEETKAGIERWRDASAKFSEKIMLGILNSIHKDFSECEECDSEIALPESVDPKEILFRGADIANTLAAQGAGKTSLSTAIDNYNVDRINDGVENLMVSRTELESMYDAAAQVVDEVASKYQIALTPAARNELIETVIDNATFADPAKEAENESKVEALVGAKTDFSSDENKSECVNVLTGFEFSMENASPVTQAILQNFSDFSTAYAAIDEALGFFHSRDFGLTNAGVPEYVAKYDNPAIKYFADKGEYDKAAILARAELKNKADFKFLNSVNDSLDKGHLKDAAVKLDTKDANATALGKSVGDTLGNIRQTLHENPGLTAALAGLGVAGALVARKDAKKKQADKIRMQNRMIAEGIVPQGFSQNDMSEGDMSDIGRRQLASNRALVKSNMANSMYNSQGFWDYMNKSSENAGKYDADKTIAKGEMLNTLIRGKANPTLRFLARSGMIGDTASEIRGTIRALNQPKIEKMRAQERIAKDYNRALLAQQLLLEKQAKEMKSKDASEDFSIYDIIGHPLRMAKYDQDKRDLYSSMANGINSIRPTDPDRNEKMDLLYKNFERTDKYFDARAEESRRRMNNSMALLGAGAIGAGALVLGAKALNNRKRQNPMATSVGLDVGQNPLMPAQAGQPMSFSEMEPATEQLLLNDEIVQQLANKYASLPTVESQQAFVADLQAQGIPEEMITAITDRVSGEFSEEFVPTSVVEASGADNLGINSTSTTDSFDGTLPEGPVQEMGVTIEERMTSDTISAPVEEEAEQKSFDNAFESVV